VGEPPCIVNLVPANLRKDAAPWIRRSMWPPRRTLRHELASVFRTDGASLSDGVIDLLLQPPW